MLQMDLDRARPDPEIVRNITVTQPLLDQIGDLHFTRRELRAPRMRQLIAFAEDAILKPSTPAGNSAQTSDQRFRL